MLENAKTLNKIIIMIFIIWGTSFYWNDIRPAQIKKECSKIADEMANKDGWKYRDNFDYHYKQCLRYKGLSQ